MKSRSAAAILALALLSAPSAKAMDFKADATADGAPFIHAHGEIVLGDLFRFQEAVREAERGGSKVRALTLDSPGGLALAAGGLADFIHSRGFSVIVPRGAECASACFIVFAAGTTRVVAPSALIGVHEAAVTPGGEANNLGTQMMRWYLEQLAVPAPILDKMVATAPSAISWLTPADLRSMGAVIDANWAGTLLVKAPPAAAAADKELMQKAVLEQSAPDAQPPLSGTVAWDIGEDGADGPEIRGMADLGNGDLDIQLIIRRNTDKSLRAHHVIEIAVSASEKRFAGGILAVKGALARASTDDPGTPLVGTARKVIGDLFWISLSDDPAAAASNGELLRNAKFIDLQIATKSGDTGRLTLEKGAPGALAFDAALTAWAAATN